MWGAWPALALGIRLRLLGIYEEVRNYDEGHMLDGLHSMYIGDTSEACAEICEGVRQ